MSLRFCFFLLLPMAALALCLAGETASAQTAAAEIPSATQLAVMKAELETTRRFQETFISMALWSLGGVITLALLVGGFGWYNYKFNHDRDLETLKESVKAEISERLTKLREELERGLSERQQSIQTSVEQSLQSQMKSVSSSLGAIQRQLMILEAHRVEGEAKKYEADELFEVAVDQYCVLLGKYTAIGGSLTSYRIAEVLDSIRKIVKNESARLGSDTVSSAVAALQRLPAHHHAATEPLIDALKRKLA